MSRFLDTWNPRTARDGAREAVVGQCEVDAGLGGAGEYEAAEEQRRDGAREAVAAEVEGREVAWRGKGGREGGHDGQQRRFNLSAAWQTLLLNARWMEAHSGRRRSRAEAEAMGGGVGAIARERCSQIAGRCTVYMRSCSASCKRVWRHANRILLGLNKLGACICLGYDLTTTWNNSGQGTLFFFFFDMDKSQETLLGVFIFFWRVKAGFTVALLPLFFYYCLSSQKNKILILY